MTPETNAARGKRDFSQMKHIRRRNRPSYGRRRGASRSMEVKGGFFKLASGLKKMLGISKPKVKPNKKPENK